MRAVVVGTSRETDFGLAGVEVAVEPANEGVKCLLAVEGELEAGDEVEFLLLHSAQVDVQDFAVVADHAAPRDLVDQRVRQRDFLDAAHVEVVHFVPEVYFVVLLVVVLDSAHLDDSLVGKHQSIRLQKFVPGVQHTVQHRFLQQEITHPLRDYDIHFVLGPGQLFDVLNLGLYDLDGVFLLIQFDDFGGLRGDVRELDCVDILGARFGAEHREDASAATYVHHDLVLEQVRILQNGVALGVGAHAVLDHVLVDAEVRLGVELLVCVLVVLD